MRVCGNREPESLVRLLPMLKIRRYSPTLADHPPSGYVVTPQPYEHVPVPASPGLRHLPVKHSSEVVFGRQLQPTNEDHAPTRLEELTVTLGPICMARGQYRSCLMLAGCTLAAVTLYYGQPVTSSVHPEVSSLTAVSGRWNATNTGQKPRSLERHKALGGSLVDQIRC